MSRFRSLFFRLSFLVALFCLLAMPLTAAAANEGYIAGYTTHDANNHQADASYTGQVEAFQYAGMIGGNVTTLHIYLGPTTTANEVLLGVYSDASSKPATKLGECMISSVTKGGWNTCDLPSGGITVDTMSSGYWLAVMAPHGHGVPDYYDTFYGTGSGASYTTVATNLTDLPSSFGTTSQDWGNAPAEFYGGTPSSGG